MADKRKPPETPGGARRRRAAPTIDIKATEVANQPADNPEAAASKPRPKPQAEAASGPRQDAETPSPETPAEPVAAAAAESPEGSAKAEPDRERQQPPPPPPPPPSRLGGFGAGFFGGLIGAFFVALLGAAAWYGGYIPPSSTQQSDAPQRLAALERQVQALQNQPAPKLNTEALNASIGALSQRVNKLESQLGDLPSTDKAAAQRLVAVDKSIKSLIASVSALDKRTDDTAATADKAQQSAAAAEKAVADLQQSVQGAAKGETSVAPGALDALEKKIATLETEFTDARNQLQGDVKAMRGKVAKLQENIAKAAAGDRAARLALSAAALRNAVFSGAPYASQLAQAKSLGADSKILAPLDRFAAGGVPSKNALAEDLGKLIPAMRKAAGAQKATGSFLERLQANAGKLVRITPVETPAGNDPSNILARIEVEAAHADIAGALDDLAKLPENVRALADEWIAKAKARQAALAAAQSFAAHAARALGKG